MSDLFSDFSSSQHVVNNFDHKYFATVRPVLQSALSFAADYSFPILRSFLCPGLQSKFACRVGACRYGARHRATTFLYFFMYGVGVQMHSKLYMHISLQDWESTSERGRLYMAGCQTQEDEYHACLLPLN